MSDRMGRIGAVIAREFLERVRSKWFLVGTLVGPLLMGGMMFLPILLMRARPEEQVRIAVCDQTGAILPRLEETMGKDTLSDGRPRFVFEKVSADPGAEEARREELARKILEKSLDAYLYLPGDLLENARAELRMRSVGDIELTSRLESVLSRAAIRQRLQAAGVAEDQVDGLTRRVELKTLRVEKGGEEKERGFLGTYLSTYLFVILLYMTILLYGQAITRGVMQERNSRILEILMSSMTPFEFLLGKILGIGSVGLLQYAVWLAFGLLAGVQGASFVSTLPPEQKFDLPSGLMLASFVVFFILGYFLYAAVFAILGAICRTEQEVQQLVFPVVVPLIIPMIVFPMILQHPDSTLSVVLSLVPVFSPIAMFGRIAVLPPPPWQIALSIVLLALAILLVTWVAARIFRVGILATGRKPTVVELWRWFRAG